MYTIRQAMTVYTIKHAGHEGVRSFDKQVMTVYTIEHADHVGVHH